MGKLLKLLVAGAVSVITAQAANATYPYYDVAADQGTYTPIALGENFELDACGSTFHRADGTNESYSLCSLSDLYDFRLTWKISLDGQLLWKQTYKNNNTANGLDVSLATGTGTVFSSIGNYAVSLIVRVRNNVYVQLPTSSWGYTGNDGTWNSSQSGWLNIDKDKNQTYVVNAASVPEPAAALLLLPALALIRRREKHQKVTQIAT